MKRIPDDQPLTRAEKLLLETMLKRKEQKNLPEDNSIGLKDVISKNQKAMKFDIYKIIIIILLIVLVCKQWSSSDSGRYEYHSDFIFDTKNGKTYSVKYGVIDPIKEIEELHKEKDTLN